MHYVKKSRVPRGAKKSICVIIMYLHNKDI